MSSILVWLAEWPWWAATIGKFSLIALGFALPLASLLTWMERRQSAFSQDRLGPERAHLFTIGGKPVVLAGLLHIVADALKMFLKEHTVPAAADKPVFRVAPMLGFVTALTTLALIPFGPDLVAIVDGVSKPLYMQVTRIDSGLLFVFALGSLGVYGTSLAGWASNNRLALLGGIRATAQAISYEVSLGLTVVGVLIVFGTVELAGLVVAQTGANPAVGWLPNWGIFVQPVGAMLFFIAAMAETKRTPFDLPEAESEIIGYFVEYSSMGFGMFMLGEFVEIVVLGGLFATLFLGGWHLPGIVDAQGALWGAIGNDSLLYGLIGMGVFGLKTFFLCALQIQIRWSIVRFRYDQLMHLGWKNLLPLALANIAITSVLVVIDPSQSILASVSLALMVLFAFIVIGGPKQQPNHGTHALAHAGH